MQSHSSESRHILSFETLFEGQLLKLCVQMMIIVRSKENASWRECTLDIIFGIYRYLHVFVYFTRTTNSMWSFDLQLYHSFDCFPWNWYYALLKIYRNKWSVNVIRIFHAINLCFWVASLFICCLNIILLCLKVKFIVAPNGCQTEC